MGEKVDIESLNITLAMKKNIISLFKILSNHEYFGRSEIINILNMSASGTSKLITKLLDLRLIKPFSGYGKGKF